VKQPIDNYTRLAYIMLTDGLIEVVPVSVNLHTFTHLTIRNRRLGRKLLMRHLHFVAIRDIETPVFMLPRHEYENTIQEK
jgi:hypothetical protein